VFVLFVLLLFVVALVLFWTFGNSAGDFVSVYPGKVGVEAVDQYCQDESDTNTAIAGTSAAVQARTGLFLAMVSSPTIDVYDRFAAVNSKLGGVDRDVIDSKGNCIVRTQQKT
jgi:hypothetical protein